MPGGNKAVSGSAPTISFTTQPTNVTVISPAAAILTAAATVSDGSTPTYQWFKGNTSLSGKTDPTLTIAPTATVDSGDYTVKVSATGAQTVTSNAAKVTVTTPVLKTIALAGTPTLSGDATSGYTVDGIKTDGSNNVKVTITTASDAGAPLPAAGTITVVPTTAGDTAKLEALTVTGTGATRTFTVKSKATGGMGDGDSTELTITAGNAAPVKLTVTFET